MNEKIPKVALIKGNDRADNIYKSMELVLGNSLSSIKGPIVLKPNLLSIYSKVASSHPEAISTVLSFIRERYDGLLYIAEGSHVASKAFKDLGVYEIAQKYNAVCFCVDTDETEWVDFETISFNGTISKVRVSKLIADAEVRISLTVPKTHGNIGISLTLKNMVGAVHPQDRKLMHGLAEDTSKELLHDLRRRIYDRDDLIGMITARLRGKVKRNFKGLNVKSNIDLVKQGADILNKNIALLSEVVAPSLSIIDGFVGMEGEGPWHGVPVNMHLAIASMNYVAADAVGCTIMGFDEERLAYKQYLNDTDKKNMSVNKIQVIGNPIEECKYSFLPHSNFINL